MVPKITKTFEEDPKMFRWYINEFKYNLRDKLDISEIIDIFNSEVMENTQLESRKWFRLNTYGRGEMIWTNTTDK